MVIDAHVHLWETQNGAVNGKPVTAIGGGKSDFGGEVRQMLPPYMTDGKNTADRLIANMDYAQVSGCVVTQEYIDGNQDEYLLKCKERYGNRIKICCLYEERSIPDVHIMKFDGIKICAGRLADLDLNNHKEIFRQACRLGKFISIDMADGDIQTAQLQKIIDELGDLKIAIGHFGMVGTRGWEKQIELARNENVYIESGGITWLFNSEFYPYRSAIEAIRKAASVCGMEKLMWGSDYPRTMTAITYLMSRDFIEKSDRLTESEKRKFLGENAKAFYGFGNMDVPPKIKNMVE